MDYLQINKLKCSGNKTRFFNEIEEALKDKFDIYQDINVFNIKEKKSDKEVE